MEEGDRRGAKIRVVDGLQHGLPCREALKLADVPISERTADRAPQGPRYLPRNDPHLLVPCHPDRSTKVQPTRDPAHQRPWVLVREPRYPLVWHSHCITPVTDESYL